MTQRIVCAACKRLDMLFLSARHFDKLMHQQIEDMGCTKLIKERAWIPTIQGFIDQKGNFLNRREAFKVATVAGQIIKKTGGKDSKELYSEDLY